MECALNILANFVKQPDIAGPVCVFANQNQEQWCGIYRAVIWGLRDFIQVGQFAPPQFMKNFSGLLVSPFVRFCALVPGQKADCLRRDFGIVSKSFQRRDNRALRSWPTLHGGETDPADPTAG